MRLPDANLLIYAVDDTSRHHDGARAWLDEVMSGSETVAFAWAVCVAFVRVTTRAAVIATPLSAATAIEIVAGWLDQPCAVVVHPTDRHLAVLHELLQPLGAAGNLVPDAHLAALAIEHGAELYSADSDFARFPGLRWRNPLQA